MEDQPGQRAADQEPERWSAGAEGYEASFAPFTGPYADEALRLTGAAAGDAVLDVAAGSGALALRAARLGAEVLAVDFADGMVALLRRRIAEEGLGRIRAEAMDGQALALPDDHVDRAYSMFGLIFFPDVLAGFTELARVVRPGGTVCVATWNLDGFRLVELVGAAISAALGGVELPATEPTWARIGDADGLAAHLVAAGLVEVEVHPVVRHWTLDDPEAFFRRLPDWSPPVQPLFAGLDAAAIDRGAEAFAAALVEASDGAPGVPIEALLGVGRVPTT